MLQSSDKAGKSGLDVRKESMVDDIVEKINVLFELWSRLWRSPVYGVEVDTDHEIPALNHTHSVDDVD